MSKKIKKTIGVLAIISIIVGVGGKIIMDQRAENEREASIKIQTQVADHIYRYYRLYTKDRKKRVVLEKKYNNGKGSMTLDEFFDESAKLREYSDIKKIKFTNIYIDQMGMINLDFIINGVYEDSTFLPSINVDRNEWTYSFDTLKDVDGYYLIKKERATSKPISKDQITYYKGRIK